MHDSGFITEHRNQSTQKLNAEKGWDSPHVKIGRRVFTTKAFRSGRKLYNLLEGFGVKNWEKPEGKENSNQDSQGYHWGEISWNQ